MVVGEFGHAVQEGLMAFCAAVLGYLLRHFKDVSGE